MKRSQVLMTQYNREEPRRLQSDQKKSATETRWHMLRYMQCLKWAKPQRFIFKKNLNKQTKQNKTEVVVIRGGEGYSLGLKCPLQACAFQTLVPQAVGLFGTFYNLWTVA